MSTYDFMLSLLNYLNPSNYKNAGRPILTKLQKISF